MYTDQISTSSSKEIKQQTFSQNPLRRVDLLTEKRNIVTIAFRQDWFREPIEIRDRVLGDTVFLFYRLGSHPTFFISISPSPSPVNNNIVRMMFVWLRVYSTKVSEVGVD